jgi:hypothetical protein
MVMNKLKKHLFVVSIIAVLAGYLFSINNSFAANDHEAINFVGDIGCKSGSIKNLDALGSDNVPLVGLGDYLYKCKPSDVQKKYDAIEQKKGVWGNHELEKNQGKAWAASNFNITGNGLMSWKIGHIQFFGLNVMNDKPSSAQFNDLKSKLPIANNDNNIWWIGIATHANLFTPSVSGGHKASKGYAPLLLPIISHCDKCFVASGHNHITAIGKVQNISNAIFGGGGDLGDKLKSLNGFTYGIDTASYGQLVFYQDHIVANVFAGNAMIKSLDFAKKGNVTPPSNIASIQIGKGNVWIPTLNGTEIINATAGTLNYTKAS